MLGKYMKQAHINHSPPQQFRGLSTTLLQVQCTMLDAWGWCTGTTQRDDFSKGSQDLFPQDLGRSKALTRASLMAQW